MIGISHIPHFYGYLVAMVTETYINNSFALSPIGFKFYMNIPKDDKYQPHTLL